MQGALVLADDRATRWLLGFFFDLSSSPAVSNSIGTISLVEGGSGNQLSIITS